MNERAGSGVETPPLGRLAFTDHRPAIIEPGRGTVSYAELDTLASGVAARLHQLGAEPGSRIGLYLRRSTDAIAAILGILRAGCAYVPVDPAAPAERNAEIHGDCSVVLSLVEQRFDGKFREACGRLSPKTGVHTVDDVGLGKAIAKWASKPGGAQSDVDHDLACVLYTSGSTGRNKGWLMTRAAVEAHARWCNELLQSGEHDAFANHAQFNFGMSLFDIFSSLRCGARLVLVPDEIRTLAAKVVEMLSREKVTISKSGPMILALIAAMDDVESHDLSALRVVAFGGEVFPARSLAQLRRRIPHPRYVNCYGSTETNVGAFYELTTDETFSAPPPIGRPCAHYEVRVMTSEGSAAKPGEIGELQFRGVGLNSGYLNQPELNAERLVDDPTGRNPWYRTCDLVIELPDGNLRYAGRIGRMVKLRGYRIEPGEIETRLYEHPQIDEVAVVPEEGPKGLRLVAHLNSPHLPAVELKQFCAMTLPAYMIPERFDFHEALPRNLRGKIDFKALQNLSVNSAD